jgi:hypothetical protein
MTDKTIIAGERLEDIEAALDLFELAIDDCGCLVMTAALPQRLSQCLNRALKTIEAEMAEGIDSSTFDERDYNAMGELIVRIAEIRATQD